MGKGIERLQTDEFWVDSTVIEAGDFVFVGYCMGNEGGTIQEQINGAIDTLEKRLKLAGLTLESVVKMDCMFRNIGDLDYLADILRERFQGRYPTRKAFTTDFLREGMSFQIDAIAYRANGVEEK